jgi:hypothetical protein
MNKTLWGDSVKQKVVWFVFALVVLTTLSGVVLIGVTEKPRPFLLEMNNDERLTKIVKDQEAYLRSAYPLGCIVLTPRQVGFAFKAIEGEREGFAVALNPYRYAMYSFKDGLAIVCFADVIVTEKGSEADVYDSHLLAKLPLNNGASWKDVRLIRHGVSEVLVVEVLDENHESPVFVLGLRE